jgi:hypothetical protein
MFIFRNPRVTLIITSIDFIVLWMFFAHEELQMLSVECEIITVFRWSPATLQPIDWRLRMWPLWARWRRRPIVPRKLYVYVENSSANILLLLFYILHQHSERKVLRTLPWHQYRRKQRWSLGRRLKDKSRKVWPDTRHWKQTSKSRTKTKVKLSNKGKVLPLHVINVYGGVEFRCKRSSSRH